MPFPPPLHPFPSRFLGVMPAYSESDGILSTKLLTFFPRNDKGLASHNALIVLFNHRTGEPTAVSVISFALKKTQTFYNCQWNNTSLASAVLHFLRSGKSILWEIQIAFIGESQLRQSRATQLTVHAGSFSVSIIYRTLIWTTGSLTCAQMFMHVTAHLVYAQHKRVSTESCLWEKNPLQHWGIEPASAACRSDALPTELHPHPFSRDVNACAIELEIIIIMDSFYTAVYKIRFPTL